MPILEQENFRLSIDRSRGSSFGCLVDGGDQLLASAFGTQPAAVRKHLSDYSMKLSGRPPEFVKLKIAREMINLYEGNNSLRPPALNKNFISSFQRRVIEILVRIPTGRITTYGLIAKHLESAPRPVGGAVASNPWPLFVPCQRVVNADLTIGNYSMCGALGKTGTITKKTLLEREKVPITMGRIDPTAVWKP